MKNSFKKISYIIIIYFAFISFTNSSDQFVFDVTEIEITEKGNKFKGLKKGVIKTDNGVIINSNTFSYIKNKNELNASGNVILNDNFSVFPITLKKLLI